MSSSAGSSESQTSSGGGGGGGGGGSSSSSEGLVYKLGFFGAGPTNAAGNTWFHAMATNANISKLYVQNDINTALWDFLRTLDTNNDFVISVQEIRALKTLKVCGYSWGAITAIGFTQTISHAGTIVVGGTPHDPIQYRLEAGINVDQLVTIDPVPILNPPGQVQNNVQAYQSWYQLNGGYSILRDTPDVTVGNAFSSLLKGTSIDVQPPLDSTTCNIRVDSPSYGPRIGPALEPIDGSPKIYSLAGSETNHDGMPWLVGDVATSLLS